MNVRVYRYVNPLIPWLTDSYGRTFPCLSKTQGQVIESDNWVLGFSRMA